jgi:hypothetical protein
MSHHEIYRAVRSGKLANSKKLLDSVDHDTLNNVHLDFQTFNGYNALNIASAMGNLEIVKYLVEERKVSTICTPLSVRVATQFGNVNILEYFSATTNLCEKQPTSFEDPFDGERSLLEDAIHFGRINVVYYLTAQMIKKNEKIIFRQDAVKDRRKNPGTTAFIRVIQERGGQIPIDGFEYTPEEQRKFMYYLQLRMYQHVSTLCGKNPSLLGITNIDDPVDTIVHHCAFDSPNSIEYVLRRGADCRKYDSRGIRYEKLLFINHV